MIEYALMGVEDLTTKLLKALKAGIIKNGLGSD